MDNAEPIVRRSRQCLERGHLSRRLYCPNKGCPAGLHERCLAMWSPVLVEAHPPSWAARSAKAERRLLGPGPKSSSARGPVPPEPSPRPVALARSRAATDDLAFLASSRQRRPTRSLLDAHRRRPLSNPLLRPSSALARTMAVTSGQQGQQPQGNNSSKLYLYSFIATLGSSRTSFGRGEVPEAYVADGLWRSPPASRQPPSSA
jgi:hypothetical protein